MGNNWKQRLCLAVLWLGEALGLAAQEAARSCSLREAPVLLLSRGAMLLASSGEAHGCAQCHVLVGRVWLTLCRLCHRENLKHNLSSNEAGF